MKPCRTNRKRIVLLVMNALDNSEAAQITGHLQGCEGCRQYHLEIRRVSQSLASIHSLVDGTALGAPASRRRIAWSQVLPASETPAIPLLNWRFALPALALIVLALVMFHAVVPSPTSTNPSLPARQANIASPKSPPADLLPTLANYRAVANQSLDQFDDLLSRQSKRPIAPPPVFGPVTLALLTVGD